MESYEIENQEINLLLDAMYMRYGYDFRSYARASLDRRIRHFLSSTDCGSISALIPRVIHDQEFCSTLLLSLSVSVTEMFRDPFVFRSFREKVVPVLKTWPHFKIWHAGCATGEEAYSLAILLQEEEVYDRTTIYATDYNDVSLAKAKQGIYELDRLREFTKSHQEAGGRKSLSEYYHARYDAAVIDPALKKNITFANHNLAIDQAFGEMHAIICRNVLIYFNQELQDRVLKLFAESLVVGGFLCLGTKESLSFSAVDSLFEKVDGKAKIFKRVEGK